VSRLGLKFNYKADGVMFFPRALLFLRPIPPVRPVLCIYLLARKIVELR